MDTALFQGKIVMRKCPVCKNGELVEKTLTQNFKYKGKSLKYKQPGNYCNACGEAVLSNSDMNTTECLLSDFCAEIDGYLVSTEIRRIRKKLGLTQREAARLFGGGHNAFSRYESGETRHPKSLDLLFRILDKNPAQLLELKQAA